MAARYAAKSEGKSEKIYQRVEFASKDSKPSASDNWTIYRLHDKTCLMIGAVLLYITVHIVLLYLVTL